MTSIPASCYKRCILSLVRYTGMLRRGDTTKPLKKIKQALFTSVFLLQSLQFLFPLSLLPYIVEYDFFQLTSYVLVDITLTLLGN